jgi:hypothetical protein
MQGYGVTVFLNKGDGTFLSPVNYTTPNGTERITAGDFNNDGIVDLAVAEEVAGGITILLGNGDGTFALSSFLGGAWGIAAGDMNGDGRTDIVTTNGYSNVVSVLLNTTKVPRFVSGIDLPTVLRLSRVTSLCGCDRLGLPDARQIGAQNRIVRGKSRSGYSRRWRWQLVTFLATGVRY